MQRRLMPGDFVRFIIPSFAFKAGDSGTVFFVRRHGGCHALGIIGPSFGEAEYWAVELVPQTAEDCEEVLASGMEEALAGEPKSWKGGDLVIAIESVDLPQPLAPGLQYLVTSASEPDEHGYQELELELRDGSHSGKVLGTFSSHLFTWKRRLSAFM